MKKILLLSSFVAISLAANAQYSLSGTAPYVQNFDGIGGGLPTGWAVYSGASATGGGTLETFSTSTSYGITDTTGGCNISSLNGGGFKNFASASSIPMGSTCTAQMAEPNRALGVKQVAPDNLAHPNLDSGASFVFQIANTAGISGLGCSFRLQSLDTSAPRVTTWRFQYKIGSTGTWTPATTTGTMTTGGRIFADNPITATFGSALDNQSTNVYFRLVTIDFSSGSGSRANTAIDSFKLTWAGRAAITDVASASTLPLSVVSAATSAIGFNFDAEDAGNYSIILTDMVGRKVATQNVDVTHGNQSVTLNGLSLTPGMYIAKISNGKTSGITKVIVQ